MTETKKVLVTTLHRGVFAGEIPAGQDLSARSFALNNARMAIYWGTTEGITQLAKSGPTETSRISAVAGIAMLHDITAIFDITPEAWEKWQKA